ncbi:MAG: hypothetical protein ACOC4K_03125 [Verrucomicrobiota bacterium]
MEHANDPVTHLACFALDLWAGEERYRRFRHICQECRAFPMIKMSTNLQALDQLLGN